MQKSAPASKKQDFRTNARGWKLRARARSTCVAVGGAWLRARQACCAARAPLGGGGAAARVWAGAGRHGAQNAPRGERGGSRVVWLWLF